MGKKEKIEYLSKSDFTGGALANFGYNFVAGLVTILTLGIGRPFMLCWKQKWVCKNTYIDGKQLAFDGNGGQLLVNYIKWVLLTIITLGIYYILKGKILMIEWQTKHTHYADGTPLAENESHFDGKWYQVLGVSLLTGFVTIITLCIGSFWAHCYTERWYAKHTRYDGDRLMFDGTAMQYFGVKLKWLLLTLITIGIYSFWMAVKTMQWTIKHTHVAVPAQAAPAAPVAEAAVAEAPATPAEPAEPTV